MTENNEFEKHNLAIDRDMEVDCDTGRRLPDISRHGSMWTKKFGIHINDEENTWFNMYGKYNPYENSLRIECEISRDNGSEYFDYQPTDSET